MATVSQESIIRYTVDFIGWMGLPGLYEEKTAVIEIDKYRGALPEDFVDIIGVRSYKEDAPKTYKPIYFRAANDTFYMSNNRYHFTTPTYKIQGCIIYTSIKEGTIEIAYKAIEVDDCGLPLIPDNAKFIIALEAYIKMKVFGNLVDLEQISFPVYEKAIQDYSFAVGACETEFKMPTYDEAESLFNNASQMLISDRHGVGFADMGEKEYRWIK